MVGFCVYILNKNFYVVNATNLIIICSSVLSIRKLCSPRQKLFIYNIGWKFCEKLLITFKPEVEFSWGAFFPYFCVDFFDFSYTYIPEITLCECVCVCAQLKFYLNIRRITQIRLKHYYYYYFLYLYINE